MQYTRINETELKDDAHMAKLGWNAQPSDRWQMTRRALESDRYVNKLEYPMVPDPPVTKHLYMCVETWGNMNKVSFMDAAEVRASEDAYSSARAEFDKQRAAYHAEDDRIRAMFFADCARICCVPEGEKRNNLERLAMQQVMTNYSLREGLLRRGGRKRWLILWEAYQELATLVV